MMSRKLEDLFKGHVVCLDLDLDHDEGSVSSIECSVCSDCDDYEEEVKPNDDLDVLLRKVLGRVDKNGLGSSLARSIRKAHKGGGSLPTFQISTQTTLKVKLNGMPLSKASSPCLWGNRAMDNSMPKATALGRSSFGAKSCNSLHSRWEDRLDRSSTHSIKNLNCTPSSLRRVNPSQARLGNESTATLHSRWNDSMDQTQSSANCVRANAKWSSKATTLPKRSQNIFLRRMTSLGEKSDTSPVPIPSLISMAKNARVQRKATTMSRSISPKVDVHRRSPPPRSMMTPKVDSSPSLPRSTAHSFPAFEATVSCDPSQLSLDRSPMPPSRRTSLDKTTATLKNFASAVNSETPTKRGSAQSQRLAEVLADFCHHRQEDSEEPTMQSSKQSQDTVRPTVAQKKNPFEGFTKATFLMLRETTTITVTSTAAV